MLENYLGEDNARRIFLAGAISVSMEKSAAEENPGPLKTVGNWLSGLMGGGVTVGKGAYEAGKETYGLAKSLALTGIATGVIGGIGYNLIKERMQRKDPEEDLQRKIEAMYANRTKELESSKKMQRARAKRDELMRSYKKMTPEEYKAKYDELRSALEEMA